MGQLCRHCSDKRCEDKGTDAEPIKIQCPCCNGAGCEECAFGDFVVKGCPNEYCSSVVSAASLVDLFEKGLPPIAGGALDQSVWFLEAARILRNDEAQIRAEARGN